MSQNRAALQRGDDFDCATVLSLRSRMLMPLLVRLTDSEIEVIDLVGSQALHGIEDRRVVIEAAGSAGLAIDHLPRPRPHHRHLLVSDGNTGVAAASASAGGTIPAGLPAMSTRFLDDGRICLSNNAAERALRCVTTALSVCTSFSSIWQHWE